MDWLNDLFFWGGKFLGIEWHFWKFIGMAGNLIFFSRFIVQWYATEKLKKVVVPTAFWWLSLIGSLLLFSYALCYRRDAVFICAYAFPWIPYIRNLVIHSRHKRAHLNCSECGTLCPPKSNYCFECGTPLPSQEPAAAKAN